MTDLAQLTDADLETICRAHDLEDSAQRGEPSPWLHYDCDGDCDDCQQFRSDRLTAMRAGFRAPQAQQETSEDE